MPFKKGISGNPGGRPKTPYLADAAGFADRFQLPPDQR
jgi:hypothetical protein